MSSRSTYPRSGNSHGNSPRSYYPSFQSICLTDPGRTYQQSREMGPPPVEVNPNTPPRPIEIDLNNSRTLPSPSAYASASNGWDLHNHGLGDIPFGSTMTRTQPIPVEGQVRSQDPMIRWISGNDGPWLLAEVIPEATPDERLLSRQGGNREHIQLGSHTRQHHQSDAGSVPFSIPHSDSGYGTRRSVGNTSVFSADVHERDLDTQSFIGHMPDYQPFQGFNDAFHPREIRPEGSWVDAVPTSNPSDTPSLWCPTCQKPVKTLSDLKKHGLRHTKPFVCKVPGCQRKEGFSTSNDLERHTKSKHPSAIPESASTKRYRCLVPGCKSKEKSWPRLDNFRSHLKRVHLSHLRTDDETEDMIRRGEFWEKSSLDVDHEHSMPGLDCAGISRPAMPAVRESLTRLGRAGSKWRPQYPEVVEPSPELSSPPGRPSTTFEYKAPPPEVQDTRPEEVRHGPVEPSDISPGVTRQRSSLDDCLLQSETLVGQKDSGIAKVDCNSPQPAPKPPLHGKVTRQSEISASDATLLEVIKSALVGTKPSEIPMDTTKRDALERVSLPNGPNPAVSGERGLSVINRHATQPSEIGSTDFNLKNTAFEVLKALRNRFNIMEKEPSHSPKSHSSGPSGSSKSVHHVTCPTCNKFTGRPSDLKKHMKRHDRPYGCTFKNCTKIFGSKNDWKRHENTQHHHLETWRCDVKRSEGGVCAKVCHRENSFQDHLKQEHQMSKFDTVKTKLEACRIGRNRQARFYCGFCYRLVDLEKTGLEAWAERFNHIDDHFMGRKGYTKQSIKEWIPVDGRTGDESMRQSSPKENQSSSSENSATSSPEEPEGDSPEPTVPSAGTSADAPSVKDPPPSTKRARTESDEEGQRPPKIIKRATRSIVYCCQCQFPHNPKVDQRCSNCEESHQFCINCSHQLATELEGGS